MVIGWRGVVVVVVSVGTGVAWYGFPVAGAAAAVGCTVCRFGGRGLGVMLLVSPLMGVGAGFL